MLICPLFVLSALAWRFHNNTNLTATNINLNTTQDTKIKGANLQATNQLNLNTKNLEVSSVQNKHRLLELVPYSV
jgi:hypothetical protein